MSKGSAGKVIAGLGLGVAMGTAFGFYALAPNVEGGPAGEGAASRQELQSERDAREAAEGNITAADAVLSDVSDEAVRDELKGSSVVLFVTPDASAESVKDLRQLIDKAGGEVTGEVALTANMLNADGGDKVKSLAANSLPSGAKLDEDNRSPGMHAGQVLGSALRTGTKEANESDRAVALGAFENGDFISYEGEAPTAADLALVVGGATDEDYATSFLTEFSLGVDSTMGGAVLVGDSGSADKGTAIAKLRQNKTYAGEVTSVDNIDTVAGRITAVRALAQQADKKAGQYGSGDNAEAPTVD